MDAGFHDFERNAPLWKKARSVAAEICLRKANRTLTYRDEAPGEFGRGLSTKPVHKCVDDLSSLTLNKLHECDIVKLVKFSPGYFCLIHQ
jgi:hypothetical protein